MTGRRPATGIGAVLFDMDGLLVDSEPLWTVAERELAGTLGGDFPAELKAAIVGTHVTVSIPVILRWYGAPDGPEQVEQATGWLLDRVAQLFAGDLPLLPGAGELLAGLRAAGVPVGLVSSSYRVLVDAALAHGFGPFDVTVAGDEVTRAKPDPEPYRTAAQTLGVDPASCVVLEDSPTGVASAEAAGCAVVAVPSVPGVSFAPLPRRLVVSTLLDVGPADLAGLVAAPLTSTATG